ncbi:HAD family hydrolase [Psychromonas sp. KJ10-2]|uniref:HAD family hydrolase n=1 Tax=Psychromonas sp. KJ10-2 TaxID=3391822 RepID=UPI0039B45B7F
MSKPLHIFDMDETLVNGDCASLWSAFLVRKGVVTDPDYLATDQALMEQYAKGELDMEEYIVYTLAPITHIPQHEIDSLVDEFVASDILPLVFPEALTLVKSLKESGVACLVISATVTFIVKKVAQAIGIEDALGIELVSKNNCYFNQVTGIATYREGKILRLQQWLTEQTNSFDEIHFYSDSINDLPLCEYADYAYLVNPCERLSAEALKHPEWQIFEWGS